MNPLDVAFGGDQRILGVLADVLQLADDDHLLGVGGLLSVEAEGGLMGGDITLSGTGTPGAEVAVLVNGEVVGTAVVGEDGTWSFPTTLSAGEYELTLQAVDGSGTAVTIEPVSLTLADAAATAAEESSTDEPETAVAPLPADFCKDAAPGIDQGDTYVVGVCEWLTKIANRLGIPYADLIGVNPQIANPNLIYPGQVINLPPR